MRDTVIIGVACLVAIAVGAWLYFGGSGTPELLPQLQGPVEVKVIQKGQDSGTVTARKNFRIKSEAERQALWRMIYGTGGPVTGPIDFEREELLAVFDGTHSTGGYDVTVAAVEDGASTRTVTLLRTEPGDSCVTTDAITSPYVLVVLPKSALPLERVETTEVRECE